MLRRDLPELPSMTPAEQVGLAQRNQQRTEALKAYETATRKLFECFDQAQVTEQMGRNINWEEALHQQNVNAGNAYATWAASCEQAWTAAAERTGEEIGRDIEQLWLSDEAQVKVTGMQEALQLVKQLEAQVVELVEAMGNLRKLHQEDYEYDRDAFYSAVKDGANEAPGVIRGPNQPGGVSPPGTPVYAGPVFPGQRPPQAQGFGMPTPERAIAGRLGGALRAAEGRVPHPATLIGAGLIALVPLAIIAVTLAPAFIAPATLAAIPYWVGALTGALAALMVIGSGLFRAARRLRVRELRKLLLSFHRTYYAYESEKKEDDQRSGLLRTLAMQLLSMRERLQNPKAFFAKLVALMRKVQGDAHETLFTTGAGGRDVFTADGQILQRDTGYTVAEFSRRLDDEIRARPIVDPDPILLLDDDELKARFLGYLRARGKLLIEMPEDEIAHTFLEFASSHYALYAGASSEQRPGYHHGDIAGPLHDEQVRRLLRSQATILREPGTAPQRHEYLCGQPQEADLFTGAETIVPTHNTDWFMVIRFLDGGGAVDLPDTLFPDR